MSSQRSVKVRFFGVAATFWIRVSFAALSFVLQLSLARILGVSEYGRFCYGMAWANVLATFALLGNDGASQRFVSEYRAKNSFGELKGIVFFGLSVLILVSTLFASLAWLLTPLLARHFDLEAEGVANLGLICLVGVAVAASDFLGGIVRAFRHPVFSQVTSLILRPLVVLAAAFFVVSFLGKSPRSDDILVSVALGAAVAIGASVYFIWAKILPRYPFHSARASYKPIWISVSLAMFAIALSQQILSQFDLLIIGWMRGPAEAGVYAAAVRVAAVCGFATDAVTIVLPTIVAEYFTLDKRAEIQRVTSRASLAVSSYCVLVGFCLVTFGDWLLGLFGHAFIGHSELIFVLCLGHLLVACFGSSGFVLTMTGFERAGLRIISTAALLNIALNLILVTPFGAVGAAVSTVVALAFRTLTLNKMVVSKLGINPSAFSTGLSFQQVLSNSIGYIKAGLRLVLPRRMVLFLYGVEREIFMIGRVGIKQILRGMFHISAPWEVTLPRQRVRVRSFETLEFGPGDVATWLRSQGVKYSEGGHTVYIAPHDLRSSPFASLVEEFPQSVGMKIIKNPGRSDHQIYFNPAIATSAIHRRLAYTPKQLTLVANFLHMNQLGPRLFDVLEIQIGGIELVAFIVDHIEGSIPTLNQWKSGVERMRAVVASRRLFVTVPEGFDHQDFRPPDCAGNAVFDTRRGRFQYLDFQNFNFQNYRIYLVELIRAAMQASHFGGRHLSRGGIYAYQSVPEAGVVGKRDPKLRGRLIESMLKDCGVSLENKLVVDVGCNIGMMVCEYLSLGARWCHGLDLPNVIEHTERLLLALGCTRFSLSGVRVCEKTNLSVELPNELDQNKGLVISYLSVRQHIGWLRCLGAIPWEFLIYEGHEGETVDELHEHLSGLKNLVEFDIKTKTMSRDGDSESRPIAILFRRQRQG